MSIDASTAEKRTAILEEVLRRTQASVSDFEFRTASTEGQVNGLDFAGLFFTIAPSPISCSDILTHARLWDVGTFEACPVKEGAYMEQSARLCGFLNAHFEELQNESR